MCLNPNLTEVLVKRERDTQGHVCRGKAIHTNMRRQPSASQGERLQEKPTGTLTLDLASRTVSK